VLTPAAVEIVRTRVDTLVPILAICVLRTSCASHEERSVQLTRVLRCSGSRRRVYGYLAQRRQPAPSHGAPGEEQATTGWAYLATVIDCHSHKIVGWAVADHMRTELVTSALAMAISRRRPAPGVIFHSDRGSQTRLNRSTQHRVIFAAHRGRYGVRRIHAELARTGVRVGYKRVHRLMGELGLRSVHPGPTSAPRCPAPVMGTWSTWSTAGGT